MASVAINEPPATAGTAQNLQEMKENHEVQKESHASPAKTGSGSTMKSTNTVSNSSNTTNTTTNATTNSTGTSNGNGNVSISHFAPIRPAFRPLLPKPCANVTISTGSKLHSTNLHGHGHSNTANGHSISIKSKPKPRAASQSHSHGSKDKATTSTFASSSSSSSSSSSPASTIDMISASKNTDSHTPTSTTNVTTSTTGSGGRKSAGRKSSASLPLSTNGILSETKPRRRARSAIVASTHGSGTDASGSTIDLSQLPSTIAPASLITKRRKSPSTKSSLKKAAKAGVTSAGIGASIPVTAATATTATTGSSAITATNTTISSKSDSESISSSSSPNSTSTTATSNILGVISNKNASDIMLASGPSDDLFLPKLVDNWPISASGGSAARDFPMESISMNSLDVWDDPEESGNNIGGGLSSATLGGRSSGSPVLESLSLMDTFRHEDETTDDAISFGNDGLVSYSDNLLESYLTPEPDDAAVTMASGFTALGFLETAI